MQERRTAQRLELKAKVRVRLVDTGGDLVGATPVCTGWTQDVSLGGVRFGARKPLRLNTTVEMDIACTHPVESCQLRGEVGWLSQEGIHGYTLGVFISETSKERLVAWRRLLIRRGMIL